MPLFSGPYAVIARIAALLVTVGSIYLFGYVKGHASAEIDFAEYKTKVETLGEAQAKRTAETIKADKERKENADATYKTRIAGLNAELSKLRNSASASSLPAAPADTRCPKEWACFDRSELDDAIRDFTTETAAIAGKGETVRLMLTSAIEWAR